MNTPSINAETHELRRLLRRMRAHHRTKTVGEQITDLYIVLVFVVLMGSMVSGVLNRHYQQWMRPLAPLPAVLLAGALTLLAAGVLIGALARVGPLYARPATMTWVLSGPVDRGRWLRPRLYGLVVGCALLGACAGVAIGWCATTLTPVAMAVTAAIGAELAVTLFAAAVVRQTSERSRARATTVDMPAVVATAIGFALGVAVLINQFRTRVWHAGALAPAGAASRAGGGPSALTTALIVGAGAVATSAVAAAHRRLGRLDRQALTAGAALANAAVVAALSVDSSQLSAATTADRLARHGAIAQRLVRARTPAAAFLVAESRRLRRNPAVLARGATLLLLAYLASLVATPVLLGPIRAVAGYIAVNGLADGLRAIGRSPGLRRSLGHTDKWLRRVHLVVPVLAAAAWTLATLACQPTASAHANLVLGAGLVAAVYRSATRPPMVYHTAWAETPFGPIPIGLIMQVLRGPDVAILLAVTLAFLH